MSVATTAPQLYRGLRGVFAVHKHVGVTVASLGNTILKKIVTDLAKHEQRPQKPMVKYLPRPGDEYLPTNRKELAETTSIAERNVSVFQYVPTNVTDWFDHPLVQGSRYNYEDFELTFGTTLDRLSSGVQLFGLQSSGRELLSSLWRYKYPRSYYLYGRFGLASTTCHNDATIMERTSWDHITEPKITRLLCMIQGTYRNELMRSSNLDFDTQHAFEMASKGLLRPESPTGPMVLDLKLKKLDLPDFVVEVTCINESCQFLRKMVHDIGLELRSTAVCMKVHRYRDAIFYDEDESTFLLREITAEKMVEAMTENYTNLISIFRENRSVYFSSPISTRTDDLDLIGSGDEAVG